MLLRNGMHIRSFLIVLLVFETTQLEIPELEYLNRSVDPCDNFYEFTCGNFKNVKPKPGNMPLWDHFIILQDELHALMKVILEYDPDSNDPVALTKSRAVYRACMDLDYSDKLDVPETQVLQVSGDWPLITQSHPGNIDFNWNLIGELTAIHGVQLFFTIEILPNLFDSSTNIIYISRDRVLNPAIHPYLEESREDFLNDKSYKRSRKHPYEFFLTKVAVRLRDAIGSFKSESSIINEVEEIFNFMKILQSGGLISGKYNATNTLKTVEILQQWTDTEIGQINLNWLDYLNNIFSKSGVEVTKDTFVMIMDMKAFDGVLNLIKHTNQSMLKNFAMTRIFTYGAPDSNTAIREAYEQYTSNMGYVKYSRSDYCTRKVLDYPGSIGFTYALTYEYQKYHFNKNRLKSAAEMVNDLSEAFLGLLTDSDWLDDETRAKATEKLDNMITLLGYPNFVENPETLDRFYENVRVCAWDHFGNSQRIRAFGLASNLALLGQPRNREVWQHSPMIANAFYNPQNNRVLLPISMLSSVFFTGKLTAIDYGRLGTVIGHEITHGYDNQGMYYDANGTFVPAWWTQHTKQEYEKRKVCFEEQYGKYLIPEINEYVNGANTVRENIADNGGLREAYRAFQELKKRRYDNIRSVEGFSSEQLFFIGYGTLWCTTQTDEYLRNKILKSNYPPARFRVIGSVSNNEAFSKAFNCPLGSKMNPENKCILW